MCCVVLCCAMLCVVLWHQKVDLQSQLTAATTHHNSTTHRLQTELAELRAAHTEQQHTVQQFQIKAGASNKYKATVQDQQIIINKLETLLQQAFQV